MSVLAAVSGLVPKYACAEKRIPAAWREFGDGAIMCTREVDTAPPSLLHLYLRLVDDVDRVVVEAEPMLMRAHERDVVAVAGPAARVHDDGKEAVPAAR